MPGLKDSALEMLNSPASTLKGAALNVCGWGGVGRRGGRRRGGAEGGGGGRGVCVGGGGGADRV